VTYRFWARFQVADLLSLLILQTAMAGKGTIHMGWVVESTVVTVGELIYSRQTSRII